MQRRKGFRIFPGRLIAFLCLCGLLILPSCESAAYKGHAECDAFAKALLAALEPPNIIVAQDVESNHNSYHYTLEDNSKRARMQLDMSRNPNNQYVFYSGSVVYEFRSYPQGESIFIDGSAGGIITSGAAIANDATYATGPTVVSWSVPLTSTKDSSNNYIPMTDGKGNSFILKSLTYTISGSKRSLEGGIDFGGDIIQVDVTKT